MLSRSGVAGAGPQKEPDQVRTTDDNTPQVSAESSFSAPPAGPLRTLRLSAFLRAFLKLTPGPCSRPRQLAQSPHRRFGDHRVLVHSQLLQRRHKLPPPAVAHRNHRIAPQSAQLRPANRRTAKLLPEFLRSHFRQPFERGIDQSFACLELPRLCCRRLPVPRTNILADVAPEHVPPHPVAHLLRNRPPLLDSQIRNTLVGIELIRRDKRAGRTSVQTARTSPAPVRR